MASPAAAPAIVVPHSHFEPEWIDTSKEYLQQELRHLKQRLDLLKKDPAYRFCSPEELTTLSFLKRCGPKYRKAFRDAVRKGQIELKGTVVNGELTMNQGESVARQFVLGKYLIEQALSMKLELHVAQNIDNYAMCPQFPQILDQCDRKYLVVGVYDNGGYGTRHFSKPATQRVEQWWGAPDGSQVLTLLSIPEFGGLQAEPNLGHVHRVFKRLRGRTSRKAIFVFSGGNMTAPDPQLPTKLRSWSGRNGLPKMKIGLPKDYFKKVRSDRTIPRVESDSITDHLGAYESNVMFRQANRRCETLLLTAEKFATAAATQGFAYPHKKLSDAWFQLLTNQDHDPALTCLQDSLLEEVMRRYNTVQRLADDILSQAFRSITGRINTSEVSGQPVVVFNSLGWKRTDVAKIELPRKNAAVQVTDAQGTVCPAFAVSRGENVMVQFLAQNVPSMGYKVFYLQPSKGHSHEISMTPYRDPGLIVRLSIQPDDGCTSVIRLKDGEQRPVQQGLAQTFALGTLGTCIRREHRFKDSHFIEQFRVYRGMDRVDVHTAVDWGNCGYRVRVGVPLGGRCRGLLCHEPFMVNQRDLRSPTVRKPVLYWAGGYDNKRHVGMAIANRGTHSYAIDGQTLYMTFFRSANPARLQPDSRRPERKRDKDCGWCMLDHSYDMAAELGDQEIEYALLPFVGSVEDGRVHRRAYEFNHMLIASATTRHRGTLPAEYSFVTIDDERVVLSTWKKAYRSNQDVLRFYEPHGKNVRSVKVELARGKFIGECNMDERMLKKYPKPSRELSMTVGPHKVKSLLVRK